MSRVIYGFIVMLLLSGLGRSANAEVNIGFGFPNVSIGINLPMFPTLAPVPGYPVYYAPQVNGNYFFYDGMYWVYQDDNWYTSSWYNGPWAFVEPYAVPLYILRIPVRYYQQPPVYFREWHSNAPPRWGQHWGHNWEQQRRGWDRWDRRAVPSRAPQPTYQRRYTGDRYPGVDQQHSLRSQSYRYQPRDKRVRQHLQQLRVQKAPAPAVAPVQRRREQVPQAAPQRPAQHQQVAPAAPHAQPQRRGVQNPAPVQRPQPQRAPEVKGQHQQSPGVQGQDQKNHDKGNGRDSNRGDRGQGRDKDEDRGRGRN